MTYRVTLVISDLGRANLILMSYCLPNSARASGILAKMTWQLAKMTEHPIIQIKVNRTQVRNHQSQCSGSKIEMSMKGTCR